MKSLKYIAILAVVLLIFFGGFVGLQFLGSFNDQDDKITVTIDKTVIVEKVQQVARLESIQMMIQRDIEVELDLGDLELFGVKLLEAKRKQKFAVTGYVNAGIDLQKLDPQKVILNEEEDRLTITIPAPEVFEVLIDEDKTALLKDDLTVYYRLQNISNSERLELNDKLQRQAIKSSRIALGDGACSDDILTRAGEQGAKTISNILALSGVENIEVIVEEPGECTFYLGEEDGD